MSISEVIDKPSVEGGEESGTTTGTASPTLHECVRNALQQYFANISGQPTTNLYDMVLAEVEVPLLEAVMSFTRGNQSKAAIILGISRGTLRKKLKIYNFD